MSQHDMNLANASGPNFRADANAALAALATLSAGATAPSPTFANQLWFDTSTSYLKMRDNANTTWQALFSLDANGSWTFKPGANDRNVDLRNASDQIVARLRADTGGDGRVIAEDRNSATRVMLHAPTTGGRVYLDGDESTGKQIAPTLALGPFNLAGLTTQDVTLSVTGATQVRIVFRHARFGADGTSVLIQLGHSGGIISSGYVARSALIVDSASPDVGSTATGFPFIVPTAAADCFGEFSLSLVDPNTWVQTHGGEAGLGTVVGGGAVSLPGVLTTVRLTRDTGGAYVTGMFRVYVGY